MKGLPAVLGLIIVLLPGCSAELPPGITEITFEQLQDKIEGGWAGQMIGVSYGAPTEFRYQGRIIPENELPEWSRERLQNSINQDDLYVEMTFAEVLDKKGLDATTEDFGAMFRDSKYALWHANLASRRALRRGVEANLAGTPRYNAHANDIDFQIEADFIGLMCPGMPVASNELCWRVGRVMNQGDGIYGGMFVSGMYAAAFFEPDITKVVQAGYACLPPESPYAKVIADVLAWSERHPGDWQRVWRLIQDTWDRRDPCPAGALTSFNIDAKLNGAYIALGLLHGGGDFERTMSIATRAGQDSDCNPSNAAGVLGVILGYQGIPVEWKSGIESIADEKFAYTQYSFREIVQSTLKRAAEMAERSGGRKLEDRVQIQVQAPQAARLEVWDDYGSPVERIAVDDSRWKWKGRWSRLNRTADEREPRERRAEVAGATAEISVDGTGIILVGPYMPDGGQYRVFLDGSLQGTYDAYSDEEHSKGRESLWHSFGLPLRTHSLRIEVLGESYGDSSGSAVVLNDVVVFR